MADLWEDKRIHPYIINQKINQLIFIPAGCAHQVRRFRVIIIFLLLYSAYIPGEQSGTLYEVACDIMLPWSLSEYLKLADEFCAENLINDGPWMTDVVQTVITAFHAYMNIRSQLANMKALEVDGDWAASTAGYASPPIDDSLHLDPLSPESPLPAAFVPDIEQGQQTQQWDTGEDKKEKNKRNRELQKARMRTKQLQKTLELFNCPWCSTDGACSLFILKHMYVLK